MVLFGGQVTGSVDFYYYEDTWERGDLVWEQQGTQSTPSARSAHAMAYDVAHSQVVMFGGAGTGTLDTTWLYDGAEWSELAIAGPTVRAGATMAYDDGRERVVLFGGLTGLGHSAETWEFDGAAWELQDPVASPPARSSHVMAYDAARERVVVFGGTGAGPLTDTWEYDGTIWTELSSGPVPPSGDVTGGAMAYEAARQKLVLFVEGETWEHDGEWSRVFSAVAPEPRAGAVMSYDGPSRRLTLLGGQVEGDLAGTKGAEIFQFAYQSQVFVAEECEGELIDSDDDGLAGCADPDCWPFCTPTCPPETSCPAGAPFCGDGACSSVETAALCPMDCP